MWLMKSSVAKHAIAKPSLVQFSQSVGASALLASWTAKPNDRYTWASYCCWATAVCCARLQPAPL